MDIVTLEISGKEAELPVTVVNRIAREQQPVNVRARFTPSDKTEGPGVNFEWDVTPEFKPIPSALPFDTSEVVTSTNIRRGLAGMHASGGVIFPEGAFNGTGNERALTYDPPMNPNNFHPSFSPLSPPSYRMKSVRLRYHRGDLNPGDLYLYYKSINITNQALLLQGVLPPTNESAYEQSIREMFSRPPYEVVMGDGSVRIGYKFTILAFQTPGANRASGEVFTDGLFASTSGWAVLTNVTWVDTLEWIPAYSVNQFVNVRYDVSANCAHYPLASLIGSVTNIGAEEYCRLDLCTYGRDHFGVTLLFFRYIIYALYQDTDDERKPVVEAVYYTPPFKVSGSARVGTYPLQISTGSPQTAQRARGNIGIARDVTGSFDMALVINGTNHNELLWDFDIPIGLEGKLPQSPSVSVRFGSNPATNLTFYRGSLLDYSFFDKDAKWATGSTAFAGSLTSFNFSSSGFITFNRETSAALLSGVYQLITGEAYNGSEQTVGGANILFILHYPGYDSQLHVFQGSLIITSTTFAFSNVFLLSSGLPMTRGPDIDTVSNIVVSFRHASDLLDIETSWPDGYAWRDDIGTYERDVHFTSGEGFEHVPEPAYVELVQFLDETCYTPFLQSARVSRPDAHDEFANWNYPTSLKTQLLQYPFNATSGLFALTIKDPTGQFAFKAEEVVLFSAKENAVVTEYNTGLRFVVYWTLQFPQNRYRSWTQIANGVRTNIDSDWVCGSITPQNLRKLVFSHELHGILTLLF